jgi:predicted transcriptional regulator
MALPSVSVEIGALVADIISAYVGNHAVDATAIAGLIQSVQRTLAVLSSGVADPPSEEKPQPAVPIKKSVFPDYIVCLEDGKKLKMLKRHLRTAYNLEPDEYRDRWGLPSNYPMVASNYAARRADLAKEHGLGRKPEPEIAAEPEPDVRQIPERRRGRGQPKAAT